MSQCQWRSHPDLLVCCPPVGHAFRLPNHHLQLFLVESESGETLSLLSQGPRHHWHADEIVNYDRLLAILPAAIADDVAVPQACWAEEIDMVCHIFDEIVYHWISYCRHEKLT